MLGVNENIYYYFVIISLIYLIIKYGRNNILSFFIILVFYDGLFAHYGSFIWNIYKAILPLILILLLLKYKSVRFNYIVTNPIIISFLLFSFSFMLSSFLNDDNLTLIFSQYSKYLLLFLSVFLFIYMANTFPRLFGINIRNLLVELLVIQGLLAIIKFLLFGVMESIIGTISYIGGAAGTVLPIIGFIFIWIIRKGNLQNRDWILVLILLMIGFGSMKRAIWYVLPVIMFLLFYYVPRRRISQRFLLVLPIIPLIFYLGVRFNPTLNPTHTYWGTFDFNYAFNYAQDYTFGKEKEFSEETVGTGRGGATVLLFQKLVSLDFTSTDIVGLGLRSVYSTDTESFNKIGYGINHKGSATGVFQTYISSGILGIFTTLFFMISILFQINNKRLRSVFILFFCWEYLFYTGVILRTPALSILLAYSIFYANGYIDMKVLKLKSYQLRRQEIHLMQSDRPL
jgi:hypothetical protein